MRVTIGELVEDFIPHTENGNKITQVEIVPRKIIEDIIAMCEKAKSECEGCKALSYEGGIRDTAIAIKLVAESLLSEFEKEGE